jgi:hypothetical protein
MAHANSAAASTDLAQPRCCCLGDLLHGHKVWPLVNGSSGGEYHVKHALEALPLVALVEPDVVRQQCEPLGQRVGAVRSSAETCAT